MRQMASKHLLRTSYEKAFRLLWDGTTEYLENRHIGDALADVLKSAVKMAAIRIYANPNLDDPHFCLMSLTSPGLFITEADVYNGQHWMTLLDREDFTQVMLLSRDRRKPAPLYDVFIGDIRDMADIGPQMFAALPHDIVRTLYALYRMGRADEMVTPYLQIRRSLLEYAASHEWLDASFKDSINVVAQMMSYDVCSMLANRHNGYLFFDATSYPIGIPYGNYEAALERVELDHVLCIVSINHDFDLYDIYVGTIGEMMERFDLSDKLPTGFELTPMRKWYEKLRDSENGGAPQNG